MSPAQSVGPRYSTQPTTFAAPYLLLLVALLPRTLTEAHARQPRLLCATVGSCTAVWPLAAALSNRLARMCMERERGGGVGMGRGLALILSYLALIFLVEGCRQNQRWLMFRTVTFEGIGSQVKGGRMQLNVFI